VLLFEEFEGQTSFASIKTVTDAWAQLLVQVKGGDVLLKNVHSIVFTTNVPPTSWWPGTDIDPLRRRIIEGGGAWVRWAGRMSDYEDRRVVPPHEIVCSGQAFSWLAYPDPPDGEQENVPGNVPGTYLYVTILHGGHGYG